uniref:Fibronectin type-III domain-containing protein n=1 Tax=Panagrellus redivivus TaxID=6233 RepID=A0A7E4UXV9_PANRE
MSHSSNNTAIRRFTYDWLIRFAELCPFETHDVWKVGEFQEGPYNPFTSKYAISPMFTTLITRYMPNLYYMFEVRILNGEIQYPNDLQQPKRSANQKQTVFICGECNLTAVPPEKYRAAGLPKTDLYPPTGMFDTIECCDNNIANKQISCMFKTLNNTFNV